MHSQLGLTCSSSSFRALLVAQFFGAFNDNLFKTVVSLLILSKLVNDGADIIYLSLTAALFCLPYILFSAIAGWLSDRYSKSSMVRWTKELELFVMALGALAFAYDYSAGLLACVFLMGMQSALFSPSKLGMLPELLKLEELSKANGYLEFVIFTAIIFGTAMAGLVTSGTFGSPGYVCVGLALIGVIASFLIRPLKAAGRKDSAPIDPITPNIKTILKLRKEKALWICVLGIAFFWSVGALFQLNILLYSKTILHFSDLHTSLLLATMGLGIGIGSIYAGKASRGRAELGLIPIGAIGMIIFLTCLGLFGTTAWIVFLSALFLGVTSGIFIVPLNAYLQEFSPPKERGSYIAASNFLSNTGMLLMSFTFWLCADYLEITASTLFLIMSIGAAILTLYLIGLMPMILTRCQIWLKGKKI